MCSTMRKRYDKKFIIEAVRLASESGNTQDRIERDLGINQGIFSRWKRELLKDGEQAFLRENAILSPRTKNCSVSNAKMNVFSWSVMSRKKP